MSDSNQYVNDEGLWDEPLLDPQEINGMTPDDISARITEYRTHINEGGTLHKTTHTNALVLLKQLRHRAVAANPRAKAATRKKAEVQTTLDLTQFGG